MKEKHTKIMITAPSVQLKWLINDTISRLQMLPQPVCSGLRLGSVFLVFHIRSLPIVWELEALHMLCLCLLSIV